MPKPEHYPGWYRKLIASKFDGSQSRQYPGRPRIDHETEQLVVRMAKENSDWGYDRIVGAMANLGYTLSDQTVGNILQRHDILPAPSAGVHNLGGLHPRTHEKWTPIFGQPFKCILPTHPAA